MRALRERALPFGLAAVVVVALALHARHYYPFLSDDALISLRYARRLIQGFGLTWSGTERVEGYSDLLWVLLNAALGKLGIDLIASARALSVLGIVVATAAVSVPITRPTVLAVPRILGGAALLAASAPCAVWAIGALEHGFLAGLLAVLLLLLARIVEAGQTRGRDLAIASGLLAAIVLLRIDGAVLAAGAALAVILARRDRRGVTQAALLVTLPLLAWTGQLAFRVLYYKAWVPNTALVKVSFTQARFEAGVAYAQAGLLALWPALLAVAAGAYFAWSRAPRSRVIVPLVVSAVWTAYIMIVGGDIFPGWRQLVPAIVGLSFVTAEAAELFWDRTLVDRLAGSAVWGLLLWQYLIVETHDSENVRAHAEMWEWDGYPVGTLLRTCFGARQPLMAVDAAGALPYWSDLPSLDMLGLNDAFLPRHPPPDFGGSHIGHDLGNGDYVWQREPDLILFTGARGAVHPAFRGGRELVAHAGFGRRYQLVRARTFVGNRAEAEMYVRRDGGPLGVRRDGRTFVVPGYFFSNGAAAELGASHELVTRVTREMPAHLSRLPIAAGTYRVVPKPEASDRLIGFACRGESASRTFRGSSAALSLDSETPVDVIVSLDAGAPAREISEVSFELLGAPDAEAATCRPFGEPVLATFQETAHRKLEGSYWAAADNVLLVSRTLRVCSPQPLHPRTLDLSTDNNDSYLVRYLNGGRILATAELPARPNGGGLTVRRLDVDERVRAAGVDCVEIEGRGGDHQYAVGHVVLE